MEVTHPIDSVIYGRGYCAPEMRAVFAEENIQAQRLRFEAVMADEQAALGMIPPSAAEEIARGCDVKVIGLGRIAEILAETQNDIVALIRAAGENMSSDAREWIHYGATSQDVHITGQALVLTQAIGLIREALRGLESVLLDLAERHANTLMIGRTHGQHALPITFGFKVAGWAYVVHQQRDALNQLTGRLLVGSLKGAVGTHAVWGTAGIKLERRVMERLGLNCSPISLQPSEERYAEFLNWCALVATLVGRICAEIRGMHRTEVAEVHEGFDTGRQVSSSTMPHKRNPEWSEATQGMAYKVRSNAQAMMAVFQEHERDATRNPPEQLLIPETTILVHKMILNLRDGLATLQIDVERMRRNLDLTMGLIAAERITFELAKRSGAKQTAHAAVYDCAMRAVESNIAFEKTLADHEFVRRYLGEDELGQIIRAATENVGTAVIQVRQVCQQLRETPDLAK
jgi:adenylosuccinate lyase